MGKSRFDPNLTCLWVQMYYKLLMILVSLSCILSINIIVKHLKIVRLYYLLHTNATKLSCFSAHRPPEPNGKKMYTNRLSLLGHLIVSELKQDKKLSLKKRQTVLLKF
jgi:hypothetical protein